MSEDTCTMMWNKKIKKRKRKRKPIYIDSIPKKMGGDFSGVHVSSLEKLLGPSGELLT